jgi:hypothetical protein
MRGTTGKVVGAILLLGILAFISYRIAHPPTPVIQPVIDEDRVVIAPESKPAPAQAPARDVRGELDRIAGMLREGSNLDAWARASEVAKDLEYETIMKVFRPRRPGRCADDPAFGIGPEPGKIMPDSIEGVLALLEDPDAADLNPPQDPFLEMAYRIQAVAEVVAHMTWRGEDEKKAKEIAWQFRVASRRFSAAFRMKDKVYLKETAHTLLGTCQACHNLRKGRPPIKRYEPLPEDTDKLVDIVKTADGRKDSQPASEVQRRVAAIQKLAARASKEPEIREALVRALRDNAPAVHDEAAGVLRALGEKETTGHGDVDRALEKERPHVRLWFAYQVRHASSPLAGLQLILADPDTAIRAKSTEMLVALIGTSEKGIPRLQEILEKEKDEEVRWAATEALERLKSADTLPAFLRGLKDEDPIVRGRSARALARLGPAAVPGLRETLKEADRNVRASALSALSRLGPAAKEAVPDLLELAKSDDALLRRLAGDALRKIDAKAADDAGLK